ncbi:hypothetical protein TNCT_616331 [Trichonephila clavata]|uniref:Uncharacterized protein n=1 Tax=Trichonephila clavata TaxID=2740835 RepID=A0A8X6KA54_TRICU|nr:hypothetical protein TNCT_616331 [Trichonephila clavata]
MYHCCDTQVGLRTPVEYLIKGGVESEEKLPLTFEAFVNNFVLNLESDEWGCEQFIHFGPRLQSEEACPADAHLEHYLAIKGKTALIISI